MTKKINQNERLQTAIEEQSFDKVRKALKAKADPNILIWERFIRHGAQKELFKDRMPPGLTTNK